MTLANKIVNVIYMLIKLSSESSKIKLTVFIICKRKLKHKKVE